MLVYGLAHAWGGAGTAEARSQKLKPTGLAQPRLAKMFAERFKKELSEWPRRTLEERAKSLGHVANHVLKTLGVPEVRGKPGTLPGELAHFNRKKWIIFFDDALLSQDTLDESAALKVASATYHESCHAEEDFRATRWWAALGEEDRALHAKPNIQARVAALAVKRPLKHKGQEADEARRWYDTIFGKGATAHEATLKRLRETGVAYDAAKAEVERVRQDPAATRQERSEARQRFQQARQEQDDAYRAYQNLPDEAAAFEASRVLESIWQEVK